MAKIIQNIYIRFYDHYLTIKRDENDTLYIYNIRDPYEPVEILHKDEYESLDDALNTYICPVCGGSGYTDDGLCMSDMHEDINSSLKDAVANGDLL